MTAPRPIRVTIDRLVLHGLAHADAAAVRRGLVDELSAALAGAELGAGDGAPIRIELAAAEPAALGRSAGRALGAALAGKGPSR